MSHTPEGFTGCIQPLRAIVFRMAETGQTRLPVVERENGKVAGMISLPSAARKGSVNLAPGGGVATFAEAV
jgi:hypothetical protein